MKKGNIIDLDTYRNQRNTEQEQPAVDAMSDELTKAIQSLIYRLRELGPLKQSN
ncbi:hypothetical protein [Aquicella lusitana]|uniref:Uncharacterized protein n=1 Tax=Aquicella lusitana TaxID=254246 RepID=A0A370GWE9_9COXI|nr:hypothetical protein [Aquicella lusitana]RDI46914.1 hypothetical protein C8D86_10436 [Aquicella lusitana]VVC73805.1 hypothetical protein AQULUS_15540 [Aquicella lusitana]